MRHARTALAICLLVLGASESRAQRPGGGSPFDRFDTNKDGKLAPDELPPPVRDRFKSIDRDGDGFVSREEDRAFFAARGPRQRGPGGPVAIPPTVTIQRDVPYAGTENPAQTLDLLLPARRAADAPLPVVVAIHGGAFKSGDKAMALDDIVELVASGDYAGVSINYRLSGEAIWPAQIHDCKAAVRWVRTHAAEFGLDPDRIGVIGGSAGGHLAAMLGTSGGIESLEGQVSPVGPSSRVQCVVDEFGPSDLLTMSDAPGQMDHNAADSPESELVGGPIQQRKDAARAASPITHVSADDPPFLIIHGTEDPLVPFDQSVRLERALREAGVAVVLIPVEGGGHGGFRSPEVPRRVRLFLDRHLRGQDGPAIPAEPITQPASAP